MDYTCSKIPYTCRANRDKELPFSGNSGVGGQAGLKVATDSADSPVTPVSSAMPSVNGVNNGGRRNKRKSAEPKRRGEVLRMRRFQCSSDDEGSCSEREMSHTNDDAPTSTPLAEEGDRPSSSDSGCHSSDGLQVIVTPNMLKETLERHWVSSGEPVDMIRREPKGLSTREEPRKSVIQLPTTTKIKVEPEDDPPAVLSIPKPDFRVRTKDNSSGGFLRANPPKNAQRKQQRNFFNAAAAVITNRAEKASTQLGVPGCSLTPSAVSPGPRTVAHTFTDNSRSSDHSDSIPRVLDSSRVVASTSSGYSDATGSSLQRSQPRSYYKSMSRQRRIEANARERTRVHTISAAFENLRRAVPAYADSQKLSKLAILKIASSYILALACLNKMDYSQEQCEPNLADCVELCTQTIQAEGKARRRGTKD